MFQSRKQGCIAKAKDFLESGSVYFGPFYRLIKTKIRFLFPCGNYKNSPAFL